MQITVPMVGEISKFDKEHPEASSGNPDNPVRPADFNKLLPKGCNYFAWYLVEDGLDFVNETMTIMIVFERIQVVDEWEDPETEIPKKQHLETNGEFFARQMASENAINAMFNSGKTKEEICLVTGQLPAFKNPAGITLKKVEA